MDFPKSPDQVLSFSSERELNDQYLDDTYVKIYLAHLANPHTMMQFDEMHGFKLWEEEALKKCIEIIKLFISDPTPSQKLDYFRLMNLWAQKYSSAIYKEAEPSELAQIRQSQNRIRREGIKMGVIIPLGTSYYGKSASTHFKQPALEPEKEVAACDIVAHQNLSCHK